MSEILRGAVDDAIQKHGGVRAAARALKCSPSYLSRLHNGIKFDPGDKLLKKLGLRKVVTVTYLPHRLAELAKEQGNG